jgi:hypothetical protein
VNGDAGLAQGAAEDEQIVQQRNCQTAVGDVMRCGEALLKVGNGSGMNGDLPRRAGLSEKPRV